MSLTIVTGAPGWLGTALVEALARGATFRSIQAQPRRVRCLVHPSLDASALRALGDGVEVVSVDLRDRDAVLAACAGGDTVFHSAGIIHPRRIHELYDVNVGGTRNLLDGAIAAGARRLLLMSSNSPAGLNASPSQPMLETDEARPYMNYGRSKFLSEGLVREAQRAGAIETVILRPCWFYGPNQPSRQSRFFKMIKGGRPIVVGAGDNLRSMSYVDNIVQAALLAEHSAKAVGQTYWIADRRPYPFLEVIETVARVLGVAIRPRYLPGITSDVARIVDRLVQTTGLYNQEVHVAGELGATIAVSIDAAVRDLGYDPEIELEEGMRRSIAWCKANGQDI